MSTLQHEQASDRLSLRIDGGLTISEVGTLRAEMLTVLTAAPQPVEAVVLDLQAVGEADSAGVQLLMSASHWLQAQHIRPVLAGTSLSVDQVARALGAADEVHCCGFARMAKPGGQP